MTTAVKQRDANGRFIARAKEPAQPLARSRQRQIRAKYDAAQTTLDNKKHWAAADMYSPVRANSADVRRTLRMRARYEYLNNTYCKSMVRILADDVIGTTPHLQLRTGENQRDNQTERAFMEWFNAAKISEKLRQMKRSQIVDGESFAIISNNKRLRHPIQIDLMLIEADRVAEPTGTQLYDTYADGITYDDFGNPANYKVLKHHPGDFYFNTYDFVDIKSEYMIHWFDADRAEQQRGIPAITPALPLFAQLRRYTLAVLASAETAADFSVFLKSQGMPDQEDIVNLDEFEITEITKRMMTTLPLGWDMQQLKAEQPTTTYGDFKKEILNEIARCLNIPFNVAIGNSSGYNYASGRLDHQTYFKNIRIIQHRLGIEVLDRLFDAWLQEAALLPEFSYLRNVKTDHTWIFDGWEHVDPGKEAKAQETRLNNHTTTLSEEYAKKGKDWEVELEQIAKEKAKMRELGITTADIEKDEDIDDDEE